MRVLVTGATGDVGRPVTARLLADGIIVRALCRSTPDALPHDVEVAPGDLEQLASIGPAMEGVDAVVHCAAHLGGGGRALHRRVNVGGTLAILEAARRARVHRLVHLSSVAVYGRKDDGRVVEVSDGYDPCPELRDDYAWSKIAAERWVRLYRAQGGLDAVVLRPGIVYGSRRDFVARVARRAPGSLLLVVGSPAMLLPLVHAYDVAEAVLRVLRVPESPAVPLDLVGPRPPTQAEYLARRGAARAEGLVPIYLPVARLLRAIATLPSRVRPLAYRLAWATQSVRYDGTTLARALDWHPGIDLERGLRTRPAAAPAAAETLALAAPAAAHTVQP